MTAIYFLVGIAVGFYVGFKVARANPYMVRL